jgi:3-oxoacyl-[acyl-carrier-protein] synthase I
MLGDPGALAGRGTTLMAQPIAILRAGAVTSVGGNAPSTFAALRCRLNNFRETAFFDNLGEPLVGGPVEMEDREPHDIIDKHARMLEQAIRECASDLPAMNFGTVPLLLCLADPTRAGRLAGLDQALGDRVFPFFAKQSAIYAYDQTGIARALLEAFKLIKEHPLVIIAGVDSILLPPTLTTLQQRGRILSSGNNNGFIPGEAACALLIGRPDQVGRIPPRFSHRTNLPIAADADTLFCTGVVIGRETSVVGATGPNQGKGLAAVIARSLGANQLQPRDIEVRISDQSGEDYYAKESAIAAGRAGVSPAALWCPADSLGETGAAAGPLAIAWAYAGMHKGYAPGIHCLCHFSADTGERAAIMLSHGQYVAAQRGR